MILTTDLQT